MKYLSIAVITLFSNFSLAGPLSLWQNDGWTQFSDDEGVAANGYVNPGWGGQDFDAEYLYFRKTGTTLHLGIQTGFDLNDGHVRAGTRDYYAGDLALSFDGDSSNYEFAIDFGLLTKSFFASGTRNYNPTEINADNDNDGVDSAGVYLVSEWNNDIYFDSESAPFAMDGGSLVASLLTNRVGKSGDSYYRTVSFDLSGLINNTDQLSLDTHWTMSCGNDAIDGHVELPEPGSLMLLVIGLFALAKRRWM